MIKIKHNLIKEKRNEEKINLVHEFNLLNHEVFNDEIILNFPLTWRKLKDKAGCTYFMGYIDIHMVVTELTITNFYDMTFDQIINVLIHEMIHVLLCQRKIKDRGGAHGLYFTQEMNRINKHFPHYNITPKESGKLNIDASHIGDKILKGYMINSENFIIVQKPNPIDEEYLVSIFVRQDRILKKDQLIEYFETNSPYFFKFKTYRVIPHGKISLYVLEDKNNYSDLNIKWSKTIKPDGAIVDNK